MENYIVVAFFDEGFIVKATGLSFNAAHDLREELIQADAGAVCPMFDAVLVGAEGAYFSFKPAY